jgi:hypothetical protein
LTSPTYTTKMVFFTNPMLVLLTNSLFDPLSNVTHCNVILMSHVSSFDISIIGQILVAMWHMAIVFVTWHMTITFHVAYGYSICHVAYHMYSVPTYVRTNLSTFLQSTHLHIS